MTAVTAADIGKMVRVGDCGPGSVVKFGDGSDDVCTITDAPRRGRWVDTRSERGSHGASMDDTMATLISLPVAPAIDPLRVYGPGAPVMPCPVVPDHIPVGTLVRVGAEAWRVASRGLGVLVLWPAVDTPTSHPCPERASCISETHALRQRLDEVTRERDEARKGMDTWKTTAEYVAAREVAALERADALLADTVWAWADATARPICPQCWGPRGDGRVCDGCMRADLEAKP